jgi:beta-fructofuranosidase
VLRFEDRWVWDSWVADDGERYHLFFLQAPRSPAHPDGRHFQVSIGHAVSDDLHTWEELPTALRPAEHARWDDYTTWTGCVVRAPDGRWLMFYTGTSRAEEGLVQRIGAAESADLVTWQRLEHPVLEADPRWYERLEDSSWPDEAWRDPYVVADPEGDGWHMLVTARANTGPPDRRGVIGHARSADLVDWEVQPPLTAPGSFGHLEVPQVTELDGHPLLLFSCHVAQIPEDRRAGVGSRGVWSVPGPSLLGPFDTSRASVFDHASIYAGRLVRDRSGRWNLLGFRYDEDEAFVGEIADPIPVELTGGHLAESSEPQKP